MKQIPIAKPIVGRSEIRAVKRVMKSGSLAQGSEVARFEAEFSKFVMDRECVAVNSGTSALHIALISLGIGFGDEVLVPSFTFAATANCVALTGATPVFIDIDPDTYNMNSDLIEPAITSKTKAILVVHLFGLPADMIKISAIAKRNNLLIVEDAAQAHLASIEEKNVGTFGDAAAFSFYPTKNMTTGEGGMVVLNDAQVARSCRLLRNLGMEKRYQNEIVGFNLRMTDIHAAIGLEQMKNLEKWTDIRIENASFLSERLPTGLAPIKPLGFKHVFHQYTIRLKKYRDEISSNLTKMGIGNSIYYPTQVHTLPSFNLRQELLETRLATEQVLSLPVHPSVSKKDLLRIVSSVVKSVEM